MDIIQAKEILAQLIYKPKYEAMIYTASVVTQLLAPFGIKPIIVGGCLLKFIHSKNMQLGI